jgi:carbon-monoxide dehydrogenase medium subunit
MTAAYHQPTRLDEALQLVARGATPVAGATGLFTAKNKPQGELCDITRLGLSGMEVGSCRLSLGATVTLTQLGEASHLPGMEGALLRRAARAIASKPLRNAITVGGNLAHQVYWADLPVVLLALDAAVVVQRAGGASLTIPVADGLKSGRQPWESGLITEVVVPTHPGHWGFGHERFTRTATDYPLASACVTLRRDDKVVRDVHVVVGAIAARAARLTEVEQVLEGNEPDDRTVQAATKKLAEVIHVGPNFRASADYRRELAGVLVRRALHTAYNWAMREEA